MNDMTPALRGLAWQYATDRISLATLERRTEDVQSREAREPVVEELVSVSKIR